MEELRSRAHPECVVCSSRNVSGLRLKFVPRADGSLQAEFDCPDYLQGYPDVLHGGMISSLLDGAMTNCLFALGCEGVTAELAVRFRHPVATGRRATVRAWVHQSMAPLYVLKSELIQDQQVKATATGKFLAGGNFSLSEKRPLHSIKSE